MKKVITIFVLIFSVFFMTTNVSAARDFIQGIVKSSAPVYKEADGKTLLKSDLGYSINLSLPDSVEILGESNNYYQIKFIYNGFFYTGYIAKNKVNATSYTTDDNYERELIEKGFPEEYATRLSMLHAIHPNWTFIPSNTGGINGGIDFYTAVNSEAEVISRNLIDSANTTLRSTEDGAYSNGAWISLSRSNWFAASRQTIAFYLDPRNFLEESHIFMFENLGYNNITQTREVVNRIIGSSFMNNPFNCLEGAYLCSVGTHNYVDSFMQAAVDKNVSPVHLATRAIQEQGSKGSVLSLGNGYNGQYVGYYNFYNIGASGKTDSEIILKGLAYAYNRNWNNQHASIYDGSSTISNSYIKIGQSTLYYQKFNTILLNYSHQYQQNVRAPYSEGNNTYIGYYKTYNSQEEWNNAVYDFLIPVYSNMGGPTTLDTSENADATLKSLSITSCNMNPSFQSSAYNYDCYVPMSTTSVTITAEATTSLSSIQNTGTINLNENDTVVKIIVTAQNGNASNYIINIHKIETDGYTPNEILNSIGIKINGSVISNIAQGSDVSNIISSIQNKYHFAKVDINTEGIVKTGTEVTVNNAGLTTKYNVVIYGDTTGDGEVNIKDLLVIKKHLVNASKLNNEYLLAADINKDGTIDIKDLLLEKKYLVGQYSITQG